MAVSQSLALPTLKNLRGGSYRRYTDEEVETLKGQMSHPKVHH